MPVKAKREEKFAVYLDFLRRGYMPNKAARAAHLEPDSIRGRRKTDPGFYQAERDAIAEFSEEVEQVLLDAAFGVVHYAKDAQGNDVHETTVAKDGTVVTARKIANRDTKAALDWLKARNSAVFNIDKAVQRHQVEHTVNVKSLFGDIAALREALEGRSAPALRAGEVIEDAEVVSDTADEAL